MNKASTNRTIQALERHLADAWARNKMLTAERDSLIRRVSVIQHRLAARRWPWWRRILAWLRARHNPASHGGERARTG